MNVEYNKIKDIKEGINWIKNGWSVFKRNPFTWIFMVLVTIIIIGLLDNFAIGRFIAVVITPILFGGIYLTAHRSHQGNDVGFTGLFGTIKKGQITQQLLILGLIGVAIIAVTFILDYIPGFNSEMRSYRGSNYSSRGTVFTLAGFFGNLLSYLWMIVLSFSVPLVVLKKSQAIDSIKISVMAVLSNIAPVAVYFIMVVAMIIVAVIPFGLGLFIAIPLIFCSNYFLFTAIFTPVEENLNKEKTLEDYRS